MLVVRVGGPPTWTWDIALTYRDREEPEPGLRSFLEAVRLIPWS